ncbi:hypothetical protein [Nonomuraea cavernae]|uniref:hypothetical protein n=1 Tax=Nonomuraea cavernae TaxID=2045107 RepID=UPI0016680EB7|nr:hypothetical protein [Nonomuraea cavernae]MCA2186394.1 hypothetical protein [Nonomuraea cavernae]
MALTVDRQFPAALAAAMAVPFDYDGGEGSTSSPSRHSCPLRRPPVVFLGSEGETGVVARDLGDTIMKLCR